MGQLQTEKKTTNATKAPASQSFATLMHRLSRAGFKKEFVSRAILPDWWDESCSDDPSLLEDVEIRVARFLNLSVGALRHSTAGIEAPSYAGAQLRRVRDVSRDRLAPAIHTAVRIASAVVRSLGESVPRPNTLPIDGLVWRPQIRHSSAAPTLRDVLADLWERGIPVVPLDILPAPSFQGIACIVENRPVILVGHKHDEPGRVAFLVAHEAGHVAAGDCAPDQPVVDEEDEITDDNETERRADSYATQVLVGDVAVPQLDGPGPENFKVLAQRASELERTKGADASAVIFAWARKTGDYATATMAVKALYRATGARRELRHFFTRHVDVASAAETDRALLRCVLDEPALDEATR